MTKLEAVNSILIACGMPSVAALDTGTRSMAAEAERQLDDTQRKVETELHHYARQDNYEITADSNGYIKIPSDCIDIRTFGTDSGRMLTPDYTTGVDYPNGRMYDRDNQTYTFTVGEVIVFTVLVRKSFVAIPPIIQEYIVARASSMHNTRFGFASRQAALVEEERRARIRARNHNSRMANVNLLKTPRAQETMGDRQPIPGLLSDE